MAIIHGVVQLRTRFTVCVPGGWVPECSDVFYRGEIYGVGCLHCFTAISIVGGPSSNR